MISVMHSSEVRAPRAKASENEGPRLRGGPRSSNRQVSIG
jgi:hypothetical protein